MGAAIQSARYEGAASVVGVLAELELQRFAADLRRLRAGAGITSYRALAKRAHYSHTSLAEAAGGKALPSLDVTMAFVSACGGDPEVWRRRWASLATAPAGMPGLTAVALPPGPRQEVVDGADPLDSGCYLDAVTVAARKVSLTDRRHIIGEIELRYSHREQAAWGRFAPMDGLDTLALHRHEVDVVIGIGREPDGKSLEYHDDYRFDCQWGDLLKTGTGRFHAWARIRFDGAEVAYGETDRVDLP